MTCVLTCALYPVSLLFFVFPMMHVSLLFFVFPMMHA